MHIRSASAADCAPLAVLTTELGYPVTPDEIRPRLERLLARTDQFIGVAVAPGGDVIGWIHAAEQDLLESDRRCEILGLVIALDHRKEGHGRALVRAAEDWARARGLAMMSVRSNVTRAESHPFYERLDYRHMKTQHAYRKSL
ncbi:MAG: N-acetyltransferase family protein [Gemmatimonadales bacterium]